MELIHKSYDMFFNILTLKSGFLRCYDTKTADSPPYAVRLAFYATNKRRPAYTLYTV